MCVHLAIGLQRGGPDGAELHLRCQSTWLRRMRRSWAIPLYGTLPYTVRISEIAMVRPNTAEPRTHRLEARIAPEALALIKRAAEAKGSSLSDFVVAAAREVAARELEKQKEQRPIRRSAARSAQA